MIRILTLALCLAIPAAAAAQTGDAPLAPSLRQNVIVTDELVRIGDLIDNAGAAAQIAVFRAPDLGATGTVAVQRIVEAVRAHDVFAINTHGLKDITVTRASRNIANTDIEERIASAIASQYRIGEAKNIGITFDRNVTTINVEPGIAGDLAITRLSFDPRSGRFDVTLDVPGSHVVRRGALRFTGIAAEVFETAVLTREVARGHVLRANDVVIERRPKRELSADAVSDVGAAVGMAVRQPIRAGQILAPRRPDEAGTGRAQRAGHAHFPGARHLAHRARHRDGARHRGRRHQRHEHPVETPGPGRGHRPRPGHRVDAAGRVSPRALRPTPSPAARAAARSREFK